MPKKTFYILLVAAFSAMLGLGVISPFLPELVGKHSANGFWMGMVFAGFAFSRGMIMPVVGRASDRFGKKIFVVSGLFLFAVISLLYPWAHNVYNLTLVRMLHGLSAGMIIPIVMAYVGDLSEEGKKGAAAGSMTMMFYMGLASGPLLGGVINHFLGFDAIFYAMSALGWIAFFIVLLFLPDSGPLPGTLEKKKFKFVELIKYNFIKGILIIALTMTLMMTVFLSFLPSLAESVNVNPDHVGLILSFGIFMAGILQVPFGKLSDKLSKPGRLLQISAGTSVSMTALFVMPLCPDFHWLMAAGALIGTGAGISTPALMNLSMGVGKDVGMGSWMGVTNTAMSIGFMVAPLLSGIVMDMLGIDKVFYVLGTVAVCGGLMYAYYMYRRSCGHLTG
jgi:MFS transporter, DHA1 family, multidrug resistance protein